MAKNTILMLAAVLLLSGCSATRVPRDMSLEQLLAGQTKAEQRNTLLALCMEEVERRPFDLISGHFYKENQPKPLLEQICKKMAEEMKPCEIVTH